MDDSTEVQKVMEKLGKANRIMEDLIDLAMADQAITEDEKQMLFSINKNLNEYAKAIISFISDNIITEDEKILLKNLERNIILDARSIAAEDSHLSDDEKKLLKSLEDAMKELTAEET